MNGTTILLWITIALIGIIAIILVKLHYQGDKLESEEGSIFPSTENINKTLSSGQQFISKSIHKDTNSQQSYSNHSNLRNNNNAKVDAYIVPEVENNNSKNYEYENENQILINYGNSVEKFQEPIKQNQMDIMSQNNDTKNEKHELKDLFTIDELIKESKRKDSEREKESQRTKDDDEELNELKESIRRRQENPDIDDELLEKIEADIEEMKKEGTISDLIGETVDEPEKVEVDKEQTTLETASVSPKDIEEAINTAAQENEEKEEVESISESKNITDVLLDTPSEETEKTTETKPVEEKEKTEIKQIEEINDEEIPTPKKIDDERKDMKYGFNDETPTYDNDLDYRKDLAKIRNTITGSKIFQDVKEKITPEQEEINPMEESYIRNVNEYEDDYAPIINERHVDFDATYEEYHNADFEQRLRQENTRKVFKMAKNSKQDVDFGQSKVGAIKEKPERDNIKLQLNNNEVVLKKGDEIIFNHQGETYSSQVYAINGDDISVRYRRKNITIKPGDVKKIY